MGSSRAVLFALLAVTLAACMNVHDPEKLKESSTGDLCEMYYFASRPSVVHDTSWPNKKADIKKELNRRQAVTPDEWNLIDQGTIQTGVSDCALKAAWGYPIRIARTADGNAEHYIYSPTRDAYITDGKVTKFQD